MHDFFPFKPKREEGADNLAGSWFRTSIFTIRALTVTPGFSTTRPTRRKRAEVPTVTIRPVTRQSVAGSMCYSPWLATRCARVLAFHRNLSL